MSSIVNKNMTDYIDEVCLLVKNKKIHKAIREELENHILEISDMYIEQGLSEEEAIKKAITRMGSATAIGNDLNKVHRSTPDILLTIITCGLVFFGLFTLVYIQINNHFENNLIENSITFALIGLTIAFLISKIDYRNMEKYSKHIYTFSIALLLIQLLLESLGITFLFYISFNNLVIFTLILSMAGLIRKFNFSNFKNCIKSLALLIFPIILIIIVTKSVTLGLIYFICCTTQLIISKINFKFILVYISSIFTFFTAYILSEPYRINRYLNFFITTSFEETNTGNYMYTQLISLIKSSSAFGNGNLPSALLPDIYTNFILTYIIYSFGWIVAITLIIGIFLFILRIGFISKSSKNLYGKLLTAGLCSLFFAQFTLGILTTFALTPMLTVGLPFISYSGSQLIISIVSISLINNVYKWRNTNSFVENIS